MLKMTTLKLTITNNHLFILTFSVTMICLLFLMNSTASLCFIFSKFFPLTLSIWSPTRKPASSASEPGSTLKQQNIIVASIDTLIYSQEFTQQLISMYTMYSLKFHYCLHFGYVRNNNIQIILTIYKMNNISFIIIMLHCHTLIHRCLYHTQHHHAV